jgi:hypothetical protein
MDNVEEGCSQFLVTLEDKCKCVEPTQNRSSWELTYKVAEKIEENISKRERMEDFSLTK